MSSLMTYKNYHAKFEYDSDDEIFVGEVIGIKDSLNFHGESVSELKEMFEECIENYLEMCEQCGKEPDKEFKGTFNVRVTPELHRKASVAALCEGISLNQFVSDSIEKRLGEKKTGFRTMNLWLQPNIKAVKSHPKKSIAAEYVGKEHGDNIINFEKEALRYASR